MIKKIALAVLLLVSGIAHGQNVDATGNVIDPTKWNNVIPMTGGQLSQVEGTGGGPVPALNTDTNTIRFSYFPYTVSQMTAINSVLSGQGISVSGFNYSWKIMNDLSNFAGTRGTLYVTGSLWDKSGKELEYYFYDYSLVNTGGDFQKFSGTRNFSSSYALESLGNFSISWTGKDQNFWSGYYGPRVRDTEITFNYTVTQPTTPTIPTTTKTAISDVIAEVTSPSTPTSEPISTQTVVQSSPVVESSAPSNTTTNNSTSSSSSSQPIVATVETTREPVQQASQQSSSAPSLSSVLSMIQTNQARENAIAQTAVAQANQVAQQAVKEAEQTAVATAMASSSQSMENSKESIRSETKDNKTANTNSGLPLVAATSSSVATINPIQSQSVTALQAPTISQQIMPGQQSSSNVVNAMANITIQPVINSSITNTQQQNNIAPAQTVNTMTTARTDLYSLLPPVPVVQEVITPQQPSLPVNNSISAFTTETPSNSSSFFTNRADPLQDYVEKNSIMVAMAQPEVRPTTVRTNVQDSTLAGNVRVERLQVVPNGYSLYLSLILRDAAFYESKEIYKNNAIKDNVRTMYFIEKGNTDTFNKMIQMQYK